MKNQEITPYTTAVTETKFRSVTIEKESSYVIKDNSAFIENSPNLK